MPDYTILVRAKIAAKCFLSEALYWRAFGRIPVELHDDKGFWRDNAENYDGVQQPPPDGEELSDDECRFAGIPIDPRMQALLTDRPSLPLEHYSMMIETIQRIKPPYQEGWHPHDGINQYREKQVEAEKYHADVAGWMPHLDEYLDEFKAEICLDLRRGKLKAMGRRLPHPSVDVSYEQLSESGLGLGSLQIESIPESAWLTQNIDWSAGTIISKVASFTWIQLNVPDLLNRYPPKSLLKPGQVFPIGASVAVAGLTTSSATSTSSRGRPPLPWDSFHVEVARLYATSSMPEKKEAAIALLQEWFLQDTGKAVSRSAIGAKLKPYIDQIGRK